VSIVFAVERMGLFCKSEPLFIRLASSGLVFLSIAPSGLGMDSLSGHEAPIRAEGNIDIGLPSTSIGTGVESIDPIHATAKRSASALSRVFSGSLIKESCYET
jgi:hypothetical protein